MVVWTTAYHPDRLVSYFLDLAEDDEEEAEMEARMPPPYELPVGLTAVNKAGQSGGGSVDMLVPNPAFDAPLIDRDGYWTGTMFVPYIRACFEWGGFPGLRGGPFAGGQWAPEFSRAELNLLTEGLQPL